MSRSPLPNEPPLLDPERALRLAEDARAFLKSPGDWSSAEGSLLAWLVAQDAALLALEVAIDTKDPALLAATLELAEDAARGDDVAFQVHELAFSEAAEEILPHVSGPITNRVRECARSAARTLRRATGIALAPRALRSMRGEGDDGDDDALKIVLALTRDDTPWVRTATREALGGVAPPAWAAFFDRDPLASRSAAEAARLRGPLDRAAALFDELDPRDVSALADAMAELPDDLAVPMLDAFMRARSVVSAKGAEPLLERWARLDTDGSRLLAWLRGKNADDALSREGERIGEALAKRPSAEVVPIALEVARLMAGLDAREDIMRLSTVQGVLKKAWPDVDPTPLLEVVLGAPLARAAEPDPDPPVGMVDVKRSMLIQVALAPRPALSALAEAMVGAHLAGFPGRWARVKASVRNRLLEIPHPRLRAHAEEVLRSGDGREAAWALHYLLKGGHDPARDPEPDAILRAAALDPRLRAAMIVHQPPGALEALREHLAREHLTPHEAIAVGHSIVAIRNDRPSPEEWAALRRARLAAEEVLDRAIALLVVPASLGDWAAEDHAYLERTIEEHGRHERVATLAALTMSMRADASWIPLLERLLTRAPKDAIEDVSDALAICRGEKVSPWTRG